MASKLLEYIKNQEKKLPINCFDPKQDPSDTLEEIKKTIFQPKNPYWDFVKDLPVDAPGTDKMWLLHPAFKKGFCIRIKALGIKADEALFSFAVHDEKATSSHLLTVGIESKNSNNDKKHRLTQINLLECNLKNFHFSEMIFRAIDDIDSVPMSINWPERSIFPFLF